MHSNADPTQIKLLYLSAKQLELNKDGSLFIETPRGTLTENAPSCYLQKSGTSVASSFNKRILDEHSVEISFQLSDYSTNETIIIDPQLVWGTFFGGNDFTGAVSADCDNNGNIYITGYTESTTNFPTQAWGSAYFNGVYAGNCDIFVLRFSNSGVLTWGMYYGGSNWEQGNSITIDVAGNIYVTGFTWSANFPIQAWIGAYNDAALDGTADIFILRFSNTGVRTWATYYGGSGQEYGYYGYSIVTDVTGNIYLTGYTPSANFPIQTWIGAYNDATLGGIQDAYILRFSNAGVRTWATYYGGSGIDIGHSIAIDASGNVYVTGYTESANFQTQAWVGAYNDATLGGTRDVFILRFSNTGNCTWATYYGGSSVDVANSIATDALGNICIIGYTQSANFPTQTWGTAYFDNVLGGTSDACILRFSNTGNRDWATYYGGSSEEDDPTWELFKTLDNIAIDACGNMYFAFGTRSADIQTLNPGCSSYYDGTYGGAPNATAGDILLAEFSKTGQLLWATYIGSSGRDFRNALAIDADNNLYICGEWSGYTSGTGLPVMNPGAGAYFDTISNGTDDSFIMQFIHVKPTQTQINQIGRAHV